MGRALGENAALIVEVTGAEVHLCVNPEGV